jgi:hypothetical protein
VVQTHVGLHQNFEIKLEHGGLIRRYQESQQAMKIHCKIYYCSLINEESS